MKAIAFILAMLLVCQDSSLNNAADNCFLLWDIPYGIPVNEVMGQMKNEYGLVFHESTRDRETYQAKEPVQIMYKGQSIKTLEIEANRHSSVDGRLYTGITIGFEKIELDEGVEHDARYEEFLDMLNVLFGNMSDEYGQPTFMHVTLITDSSWYTVPIYDFESEITVDALKDYVSAHIFIGIRVGFNNVLLNGIISNMGSAPLTGECSIFFRDRALVP